MNIPRGPAGQEVDVRFTYDLNGVLEVEATVVATRETFTQVITRHARGLSPDQVARAVLAMQALKTHPREEAVNRFLLRRAERLYGELSLEAREVLGVLLDGFEGALELGEPEAIQRHRAALEEFLDGQDFGSGFGDDEEDSEHDAW
jgi:molecular chaperone HscC